MVWLSVMMPQKMASAKNAGVFMATLAGTPSTTAAGACREALSATSSAP